MRETSKSRSKRHSMAYRARLLPLALFLALAGGSPATASDIFAGRKVYDAHCAQCHGGDGRALVAGSPDFNRGTALNLTDGELIRRIRAGRNLMPGYEGILKTKDMLNVIAYMRTLRR